MAGSESSNNASKDPLVWLELWKKTVDVQQHFNDLELRIRNFSLVIIGTFIGVGGYAIKEEIFFQILGINISSSAIIILMSLVPLLGFYFMDRFWYHRLLEGAVKAGARLERELKNLGYDVGLGEEISKSSPVSNLIWGARQDDYFLCLLPRRMMHSKNKISFFYLCLAIGIVLSALILSIFVEPSASEKILIWRINI